MERNYAWVLVILANISFEARDYLCRLPAVLAVTISECVCDGENACILRQPTAGPRQIMMNLLRHDVPPPPTPARRKTPSPYPSRRASLNVSFQPPLDYVVFHKSSAYQCTHYADQRSIWCAAQKRVLLTMAGHVPLKCKTTRERNGGVGTCYPF